MLQIQVKPCNRKYVTQQHSTHNFNIFIKMNYYDEKHIYYDYSMNKKNKILKN